MKPVVDLGGRQWKAAIRISELHGGILDLQN
jgi:hypothetical protein